MAMKVVLLIILFFQNALSSTISPCYPYFLESDNLPTDPLFSASVANGHIGSIVYHPVFHVNGFYNGNNTDSTYAKIPNLVSFRFLYDNESTTTTYVLNMYDGYFTEQLKTPNATITTKIYAHQYFKTIMAVEVEINITSPSHDQDFSINLQPLTLNYSDIDDMTILQQHKNETFTFLTVTPLIPETTNVPSPNVTVIGTTLPNELTVKKGQSYKKFVYIFAAYVNNEQGAWDSLVNALKLSTNGSLFELHQKAWNSLWEDGGGVDVIGNCTVAQTIHASFYYILSSLPTTASEDGWPFYGITPASLAQSDLKNYRGHVFWDQETWMLPGILVFYPDVIKRVLIDSRFSKLKEAQQKATYMGYKGSMFPWESAYTGYEASPWPPSALREIHITGDIALSMQQYLYFTNDTSFVLHDGAYEVFAEISKFWASRQTSQGARGSGDYDVLGPDEWNDHVNNSAYTNSIAQLSMRLPNEVFQNFVVPAGNASAYTAPDPQWLSIANMTYIPFDDVRKYHPEFDGFQTTTTVKQADVVLLGFPLMLPMNKVVRLNDLNIYENLTSPLGPAMTWSMHTVGLLEVNQKDRADALFQRNFDYIREPFKVWSENTVKNPDPGAINFVTGMGGFLQSVVYGYYGIRVYSNRMEIKPMQIPYTQTYTLRNVKYMGNVFDSTVLVDTFNITLKKKGDSPCDLHNLDSNSVKQFESEPRLNFGKYSIVCPGANGGSAYIHSRNIFLLICAVFVSFFILVV